VVGERSLAYVALGDTLYNSDSVGFQALTTRIGQGADSLRAVVDSAVSGQLHARLPGLVGLTTGLFDPTVSTLGRGATSETAIIRQWKLTDAGSSFVEIGPSALVQPCLHV
jgi:hypothetical protein